jgi:hypothetical protein
LACIYLARIVRYVLQMETHLRKNLDMLTITWKLSNNHRSLSKRDSMQSMVNLAVHTPCPPPFEGRAVPIFCSNPRRWVSEELAKVDTRPSIIQ